MRKIILLFSLFLALALALVAWPQAAFAHQTITVGDYAVEYGWVNEPAVAGQPNAVVINLSPKNGAPGNIDISGLKIAAVYGGQTKVLTLQPLGENTPGQFTAPITPMRAGKYTIHLSGSIGATQFNTDVQPEEVQTADVVQFPAVDTAQAAPASSNGAPAWVGYTGLALGVIATLLALAALLRRPAMKG